MCNTTGLQDVADKQHDIVIIYIQIRKMKNEMKNESGRWSVPYFFPIKH